MKKHQSLFTLIFAIYVITGIAAIVLFHNNGSHLSHKLDQPVLAENESVPETVDSGTPDIELVEVIETPDEDVSVSDTNDTNTETNDGDMPDTTDTEEQPEEEVSGSTTDTEEQPVEEVPDTTDVEEPSVEEISDDTDGKTYYGYTVNAGVSSVRVRETADRSSKIISHVNGGDTGYVIEKGDIRSQIVLQDGTVGYVYNEYITISEIPKKEVPKEYR